MRNKIRIVQKESDLINFELGVIIEYNRNIYKRAIRKKVLI